MTAGKAYAKTAATMREKHKSDRGSPLPEKEMGPAYLQVFLESMDAVDNEKSKADMGKRGKEAYEKCRDKWEAYEKCRDKWTDQPMDSLLNLVKAYRVSSAWAEGTAKLQFHVANQEVENCICEMVHALGGDRKTASRHEAETNAFCSLWKTAPGQE